MAVAVAVRDLPPASLAMLADTRKTVKAAIGSKQAVMEPKLNGWRGLFRVEPSGKVRAFTRNGKELTGKMPSIEAELAEALPPGSIIDGEIVAFTTRLMDDRTILAQDCPKVTEVLGSGTAKAALASGALTFMAFDLIAHGQVDARNVTFEGRRGCLEKVFENNSFDPRRVALVPQVDATAEQYEAILAGGYEGAVVKWLDSVYASGQRGRGWWKIKPVATVDVVITGFNPGTPGSSLDGLIGSIEFGQYSPDGLMVNRGRCSGMDWALRVDLTEASDKYIGRVFELAYQEVTKPSANHPFGAFLFPRFVRFRPDKSAAEVTIHDA